MKHMNKMNFILSWVFRASRCLYLSCFLQRNHYLKITKTWFPLRQNIVQAYAGLTVINVGLYQHALVIYAYIAGRTLDIQRCHLQNLGQYWSRSWLFVISYGFKVWLDWTQKWSIDLASETGTLIRKWTRQISNYCNKNNKRKRTNVFWL